MSYELPKLPYAYDTLEPYIDAQTMEIHHTKHHQAYITNVNKALEGLDALAAKPVDDLLRDIKGVPEDKRQAVINNGGGHANHSLFWQILGKGKGGAPKGELAKAIDAEFGGYDAFKEKFANAALTRFGSGWAWLGLDKGRVVLLSTPNQDSPLLQGITPLLGLDVWEHAYYLKYQNRRADYIAAWWNVVDWDRVTEFYKAAKG